MEKEVHAMNSMECLMLLRDERSRPDDFLADVLSIHYEVLSVRGLRHARSSSRRRNLSAIILEVASPGDASAYILALRTFAELRKLPVLVVADTLDSSLSDEQVIFRSTTIIHRGLRPKELLDRIAAEIVRQLRRAEAHSVLRCARLEMNLANLECRIAGEPVATSNLEFNLLRFLVENTGRLLRREEILRSVWPGISVNPRCVDTQINSLRKKLGTSGLSIKTRYGVGYALVHAAPARINGEISC